MERFEYRVHVIGGGFRFRSSKHAEIQEVCDKAGRDGWELVSVTYDWLVVSHVLYFKRKLSANK